VHPPNSPSNRNAAAVASCDPDPFDPLRPSTSMRAIAAAQVRCTLEGERVQENKCRIFEKNNAGFMGESSPRKVKASASGGKSKVKAPPKNILTDAQKKVSRPISDFKEQLL
jgi:hypothetical protein